MQRSPSSGKSPDPVHLIRPIGEDTDTIGKSPPLQRQRPRRLRRSMFRRPRQSRSWLTSNASSCEGRACCSAARGCSRKQHRSTDNGEGRSCYTEPFGRGKSKRRLGRNAQVCMRLSAGKCFICLGGCMINATGPSSAGQANVNKPAHPSYRWGATNRLP